MSGCFFAKGSNYDCLMALTCFALTHTHKSATSHSAIIVLPATMLNLHYTMSSMPSKLCGVSLCSMCSIVFYNGAPLLVDSTVPTVCVEGLLYNAIEMLATVWSCAVLMACEQGCVLLKTAIALLLEHRGIVSARVGRPHLPQETPALHTRQSTEFIQCRNRNIDLITPTGSLSTPGLGSDCPLHPLVRC